MRIFSKKKNFLALLNIFLRLFFKIFFEPCSPPPHTFFFIRKTQRVLKHTYFIILLYYIIISDFLILSMFIYNIEYDLQY